MINTEVAIIGAGFAGVSSARRLHREGIDFHVFEARDRIGGRVQSAEIQKGQFIDLGAQWIGPSQHHMWELVKELDITTFETFDEGKNVLDIHGKRTLYSGVIPRIGPFDLLNLGYAMNKFNRMSSHIPLEAPWNAPRAAEWDSMTVEQWMRKNVPSAKARYLMKVGLETVFACHPSEISLLHALFYNKSGDNLDSLISIQNGAQQTRFHKGSGNLLDRMAEPFQERIHLEAPVYRVEETSGKYRIQAGNLEAEARYLILALPPALMDRIRFSPLLPAGRAQLHQRMPMGSVIKCFAVYETPFWREAGLSGQVVSDDDPVNVVFDNSPDDASLGILLAFIEGNNARKFTGLPYEQRKATILEKLAKHFGKRALQAMDYQDKSWAEEEWSRGCYVGYCPPGVLTGYGNWIREPVGNIHWAGTETAIKWNGYMDGAVESGYRAADEILAKIRG